YPPSAFRAPGPSSGVFRDLDEISEFEEYSSPQRKWKMKVLLSAYSCCPTKTSEPGNAWRAINEAIREHEVWAIIEDGHGYKERTETYLAKNPMPRFHPVFLKLPSLLGKAMRGRAPLESPYYHYWQEKSIALARELHQRIKFDLTHHV